MSAILELPEPLLLDPVQEQDRLDALRSLDILDTLPEDRFDRITKLAAEFFQVPISYVALIDSDRQWFKSRHGLCMSETSRGVSFCQYTIHKDGPFIIHDALDHPLGRTHPLVVGEPYVRFYAGVPLMGPRGKKIGTFCLIDKRPRTFTEDDVARLMTFAAIVEREINLGQIIQTQNELLETREELVRTQNELNHEFADAAKYVRLMLPPPISGREIIDWQFHPSTHLGGDGLGYRRINEDLIAFYALDVTGHGLGSALLAVTALELLRNRAAMIDFSKPAEIMDRLNRTFQMKDHAGKFFSVWYGVYSHSTRKITYANAGHPPPLLLTRERGVARLSRTPPGGSVLGVLPDQQTPVSTIDFPAGSELLLFTDGLYELTDAKGGHGSYDEFLAYLAPKVAAGGAPWEIMLSWLDQGRTNNQIEDDVTLLRFATPA